MTPRTHCLCGLSAWETARFGIPAFEHESDSEAIYRCTCGRFWQYKVVVDPLSRGYLYYLHEPDPADELRAALVWKKSVAGNAPKWCGGAYG